MQKYATTCILNKMQNSSARCISAHYAFSAYWQAKKQNIQNNCASLQGVYSAHSSYQDDHNKFIFIEFSYKGYAKLYATV